MQEYEAERALKEAIEKTDVGNEVNVSLNSISSVIDVNITVEGGWEFSQTILPGGSFRITKGVGEIDLNITIRTGAGLN